MGRITQDLDLKSTTSGTSVLTFNIAVDRGYVKQGEERQSDFITCVAWQQKAEFISKHFAKGRMIALEGNLRSRTYEDKNGSKHYVTEVYIDNVSFTGEKASDNNAGDQAQAPAYKGQSSQPASNAIDVDFEDVLDDNGVPFF